MAKPTSQPASGEVVESISFRELCQVCGAHADWIADLVDEGIIAPEGSDVSTWRFTSVSITRARKAWRLHRDLGVNLAGIALALDLMAEMEALQARLRRVEYFATDKQA